MMFLYEDGDSKNPIDMMMIDWQLLRPASPVYDMSYFFLTISPEELLNRTDEFLKVYHDELSRRIRELGDNNTIKEELLISQELETTSKGKDVMKIICDYFERHGIEWKRLAGFCTDGAPAMLGSRSGLATLVKEKNPSTVTMHCIIHRQALASKTLPEDLSNTMKLATKMMNTVKNSAFNSRIFRKLCAALDSEYETYC
ncbi:Ecdysteroid kinase-like family [Popillia japonica]|uniref:Ecdysteroid kinase-like family n=1 Tax=Popillia japonica TaxID=7064 RepID=A0AAW1K3B5_POPJA